MGLRFIYGRAGSGKSSKAFSEIANQLKQKNNPSIYLITPEQFSFTAEKKLMEAISTKAVMQAEVLTFKRMAYRIMTQVGGGVKTRLSNSGKAMLLYDILNKEKKNLAFLGKSKENIEIVGNAITEFKKHGITLQQLQKQYDQETDPYLKNKLEDMYRIYQQYTQTIGENMIEEDDILTVLLEKIEETKIFDHSIIYIDEFAGFTYPEYELIKKLIKIAKQVTITISTDSLKQTLNPDTDIFFANKQVVDKLQTIAKKSNIPIEEEIKLEGIPRFEYEELRHLEQNIYQVPYHKYEKDVEHIHLFLASNPYAEIEEVAKQITKLVKYKNYHYRDIAVITKNMDIYSGLVKAIFMQYHIPVFLDEKKQVNQIIMVQYLLSIIEIFTKNWSYEAVFQYIKTGFLQLEQDEIFKLEHYCLRWGIKGKKWYITDWTYGVIDEDTKKQVARWNEIRRQIVEPLLNLKSILQENKNCYGITNALYNFLMEQELDKKLENKINQLQEEGFISIAAEYKKSWDTVIQVLDELVLVFDQKNVTLSTYFEMLKIGLANSTLRNYTSDY